MRADTAHGRTTHVWAIRAAFLVPVVVVAAQFLVIGAGYGEPYPALMMPGFKGTLTAPNGNIQVESAAITIRFADGSAASETLRSFFGVLPTSHHWTVATNLFRTPAVAGHPAPPARSGLKGWIIRHLTPIRDHLAEQRRLGRPIEPATEAWLRSRLADMYEGKTATHVDFEWRLDEHRLADGGNHERVSRVVVDRYTVTLPDTADARP